MKGDNEDLEPSSDESEPTGIMARLRANSRFVAFISMGLLLLILALTGVFGIDSATDLSAEEAIEIARAEIDFVPVTEGARFVRQGAALRPVWAVSFSIPGDSGRQFERLMTVELDAQSGDVIRISTDGGADDED